MYVTLYSTSQKIWPFIFQSHTITSRYDVPPLVLQLQQTYINWRKIYMRFWEELFKNLKEHHWHDSLRKLTFPLLEEMKIFSVLTDVDLTSSVPSARMIQSAEVSDGFFWGLLWPLLFYSRFSLALFWPWRYVSQKSNQNEGKINKGQARVLLLYLFSFFSLLQSYSERKCL